MDSKRTYMYNVVLRENDVCPQGELLTDKELERMKQHNPRRDWPETKKAKVYADSYAALMCRVKQRRYIVLEQVTEWDGTPQENA